MCASIPALPSVGEQAAFFVRSDAALLPHDEPGHVVEHTFYATEGIPLDERLLPTDERRAVHPVGLAPGVTVAADGRLVGTPRTAGTYAAPVRLCLGDACEEQTITLVVYRNVPWEPRNLTFPGRVGVPLDGEIAVNGGPAGVLPTFTVTDHGAVPEGIAVGPDGRVGGTPVRSGVSEIPVRICLAGNCAGAVVKVIVV
jgi:hypothetical protein